MPLGETPGQDGEIFALASEVLAVAQGELMAALRLLSPALLRLAPLADTETTFAADGQFLHYHPVYVLRQYQTEPNRVCRALLHSVLHCLFHHPFGDDSLLGDPAWALACDIAVETSIDELDLPCVEVERPAEAEELLSRLRQSPGLPFTAEKLYHHFSQGPFDTAELENMRRHFRLDDHGLWRYGKSREEDEKERETGDGSPGEDDARPGENGEGEGREGDHRTEGEQEGRPDAPDRQELPREWKRLASQLQSELESRLKERGDAPGSLLASLRLAVRERVNYEDFLRRFAVVTEIPKPDPDSFDPIPYVWGLDHLNDTPLVEPQESSEAERIRDFVLVLDTSASVQGEKLAHFLSRTIEILLSRIVATDRLRLHLIECDAAVQRDTLIRGKEDLEELRRNPALKGGGGTDFRPAFAYVEELCRKREITDLRGILYFTDGEGIFPKEPPAIPQCKTAFLFTDGQDVTARVPPWAIRVLLDPDTLDRPRILVFAS